MKYPLILPRDVFVWRAVPAELNRYVLRPPDEFTDSLPAIEHLPSLSRDMKRQLAMSADWQSYPERRPTHCAFMDEAARYIHEVGIISTYRIAAKCKVSPIDANGAFKVLTGLSVREWSTQYTRLMIADLQERTSLTLVRIAAELRFPSAHALVMFLGRQK